MDKGDFKSWDDAIKFYKEEYKDLPLEEFMDRMTMRWEDGEFEDVQAFARETEEGIKKYISPKANQINLDKQYKRHLKPKSRWAKETVKLLKKHGEMKNNDIILALNEKGMPPSYRHLCQIFKSESDRKFYKEELVNNGSYFSLKTTK